MKRMYAQLKRMYAHAARSSEVYTLLVYTYNTHPNTTSALPLTGKRPKQQQSRQAPQRQHVFHTYQAPGTSIVVQGSNSSVVVLQRVWDESGYVLCNTTMQRFPWIPCMVWYVYDLRVAQPNKKNGRSEARSAPIFALLYTRFPFGKCLEEWGARTHSYQGHIMIPYDHYHYHYRTPCHHYRIISSNIPTYLVQQKLARKKKRFRILPAVIIGCAQQQCF